MKQVNILVPSEVKDQLAAMGVEISPLVRDFLVGYVSTRGRKTKSEADYEWVKARLRKRQSDLAELTAKVKADQQEVSTYEKAREAEELQRKEQEAEKAKEAKECSVCGSIKEKFSVDNRSGRICSGCWVSNVDAPKAREILRAGGLK